MSDSSNAVSIIGFVFFALSELLPLLPIPANGFLHSLFIGLKNSFAKQTKNVDLEIAQSLVNTRPEFVELVNTIEGNSNLIDALKMFLSIFLWCLKTFSRTTMESSTTIPMTSKKANSDIMFNVMPM